MVAWFSIPDCSVDLSWHYARTRSRNVLSGVPPSGSRDCAGMPNSMPTSCIAALIQEYPLPSLRLDLSPSRSVATAVATGLRHGHAAHRHGGPAKLLRQEKHLRGCVGGRPGSFRRWKRWNPRAQRGLTTG